MSSESHYGPDDFGGSDFPDNYFEPIRAFKRPADPEGEIKTMNTDPKKSAQPCGCDEGANHTCEVCKAKQFMAADAPYVGRLQGIKDSGQRVTYASGSMRDPSTGKIKWSRITWGPMMRRWAQHLTTAEAKYPDPEPGVPNFSLISTDEEYVRYKESAFRHFMSWFNEETDEDHAAATFFNINGVEIIKDKRKAKDETAV